MKQQFLGNLPYVVKAIKTVNTEGILPFVSEGPAEIMPFLTLAGALELAAFLDGLLQRQPLSCDSSTCLNFQVRSAALPFVNSPAHHDMVTAACVFVRSSR